jgi:DNA invertase Pin-like site-specific DNA recombinase
MEPTVRALGYGRVSTSEQTENGYGLTDQDQKLRAEIKHRGWELVDIVMDEGESGKDLDRPQIRSVLDRIAGGEADALVVTKLDRLTRSTLDFAELAAWSERLGVRLVVLDLGIDTGTETGRLVAGIMAEVAQWERRQIAARTRDAASVRRVQGKKMGGVGVRDSNPALASRIKTLRDGGATWQSIADALNTEHVPTVRGGLLWRVSAVQSAAGYIRPPVAAKRVTLPEGKRRRRVV